MKIYRVDSEGVLTGEDIADEDPLEPGRWVLPFGTTMVAPPAFSEGQRARFTNAGWIIEALPAPAEPPAAPVVQGIPDIISASYQADGRVMVRLAGDLVSFCAYEGLPDGPLHAHLHAWLQVEGHAIAPYVPPPEPVFDALAYAAYARWRKEIGGITIAGIPIATDDRAKLMVTGARVAAMADPTWTTVWYGSDGNTYPLDAAAMISISDAVQAHVNQTFATFAVVKAAIEAGTIADKAGVDAAFAEGIDV